MENYYILFLVVSVLFSVSVEGNVCSAEKLTKPSTVLLLRLVSFYVEQTLSAN